MSSTNKSDSLDRLILIRIKVERAKKHLNDLSPVAASLESTTVVMADLDANFPSQHNFSTVPTLPVDVMTVAGDVVHNLRTALDHLARQLVLVGMECAPIVPLTERELRRIEFPIAETIDKYESEKAGKIKGMLPEAIEAIDRLKPYKGGNDALWRISELDNIDKHRSLFTLGKDFLFTADWFSGAYLMKAENPLFAGIESEMEKDVQSEIEEAFSQPQVTEANALLPSLHQLADFVDNLIFSFRPLLRNVDERVRGQVRLPGGL